jgi:hypothetical protein
MRRSLGIWIVGLTAAALGAAAVGTHASAAAPTRAAAAASTIDKTYSCKVRRHSVDLYASVDLPAAQGQPASPGFLGLTTGVRTREQNGVQTTVAQVSLSSKKNSLRIDTKSCQRVKRKIPLKPRGLPTPPNTVTPTLFGHDSERCGSTARVLFRLRVTTSNHTPTHALFAVRDDSTKRRPIAFYRWSPSKVSAYPGQSCVGNG